MSINPIGQVKADSKIPEISPGDTVRVSFRVREANRERVQTLLGLVVRVKRGSGGGNFTVRRVTYGVGVEHTFPFASPLLEKVEIVRRGKVRRAKLYYMRRLSAREARLKERREMVAERLAVEGAMGEVGEIGGAEAEGAEIDEAVVAEAEKAE